AEIGEVEAREAAKPLELGVELHFGAGVEDIECRAAHLREHRTGAQLVDDGESRDLPHRGFPPASGEPQHDLPVLSAELVVGELEALQRVDVAFLENPALAVERLAAQVDDFRRSEEHTSELQSRE